MPRGYQEVVGLLRLEHQAHGLRGITGESPVAPGVEVVLLEQVSARYEPSCPGMPVMSARLFSISPFLSRAAPSSDGDEPV